MASGTLSPDARQQFLDSTGKNPLISGKLNTYLAGTTTPAATYTDVGLLVPNANPIILDAAGRATIYLSPGNSYKYVLQDSTGATVWTQDNIPANPSSSSNSDIIGVAGQSLSAGQPVYLSDGSGSKTAGQWYPADPANPYSSTLPEVGIAIAAITNGAAGTIRLLGSVPGLSSLTIGTAYYVGTAGTLTSTAPTNARFLGVADTVTSLVLKDIAPVVLVNNAVAQGRLTLTTAVPVTTADVLAATTIRYAPYSGNQIALYNGTAWAMSAFTELSIAVPATTSQMYDVFVFNNSGVLTLELLAWTNDTTRATALVTQDGVLCKTGVLTRRYVGSFRTTGVSGQTEDSFAKRHVWNYNNRVPRSMRGAAETTDSWIYDTVVFRQANANAANQLDFVLGVAEVPVTAVVQATAANSAGNVYMQVGIGSDSTTTNTAGVLNAPVLGGASIRITLGATLRAFPAVGRHTLVWLEKPNANTADTTWYGDDTAGQPGQNGISGEYMG